MACVVQKPISWFIVFGRECNMWFWANRPMLHEIFPHISPGTHLKLGWPWLGLQSHTIDPSSKPNKQWHEESNPCPQGFMSGALTTRQGGSTAKSPRSAYCRYQSSDSLSSAGSAMRDMGQNRLTFRAGSTLAVLIEPLHSTRIMHVFSTCLTGERKKACNLSNPSPTNTSRFLLGSWNISTLLGLESYKESKFMNWKYKLSQYLFTTPQSLPSPTFQQKGRHVAPFFWQITEEFPTGLILKVKCERPSNAPSSFLLVII